MEPKIDWEEIAHRRLVWLFAMFGAAFCFAGALFLTGMTLAFIYW